MAIAIVIILLVIASIVFHFISPWWFTEIASNWTAIDTTINITFWITGFVFVAVNGFLAYVVFRYRFNKNRRADYEPENKKLETWLTVITTIGVAALLAPGLVVWGKFVNVPDGADIFEAVGQQWHWSFRLPGKDGKMGRSAVELMSEKNPFGLDPNDPFSQDDILINSNEMHLPINRPVKALLRSKDVLHNFAVPQFRVKMDLVPGLTSYLWFTPTRQGRFELLCEELCGMAHYTMRGYVVVDSAENYQKWLDQQTTFSQSYQAKQADIQLGQQLYGSCAACHGQQAQGNKVLNAPKLAGQSIWYLKRQLSYFKNGARGSHKQDIYGQQMATMAKLLVDDEAITNVAGYINSLSQLSPAPTAANIVSKSQLIKGQKLYNNCAYCHGKLGQGNFNTNAPKLAGQDDWYLKKQLLNYQSNIRGRLKGDIYGNQMLLMSKLLHDETAIDNVIAYIGTLSKPQKPKEVNSL
ncbi:MAG: c-type cytochrome [Colwellia sp.]|nr:c-type cytochrome [Colwellia sp.]